jgi:hypothetical protein
LIRELTSSKLHFGDLGGVYVGSSISFVERSPKGLFTPAMQSHPMARYIEVDDLGNSFLLKFQ